MSSSGLLSHRITDVGADNYSHHPEVLERGIAELHLDGSHPSIHRSLDHPPLPQNPPINDEDVLMGSDLRSGLFGSIPEYPHSSDFQRVIITESTDPVDRDTIEACRELKVSHRVTASQDYDNTYHKFMFRNA